MPGRRRGHHVNEERQAAGRHQDLSPRLGLRRFGALLRELLSGQGVVRYGYADNFGLIVFFSVEGEFRLLGNESEPQNLPSDIRRAAIPQRLGVTLTFLARSAE